MREALQSPKFKKAIAIFAIAVVILVVFAAGTEVGYMKAGFSYKFGESYYRSFGQGAPHPLGLVPGDVGGAHGFTGKIVSKGASGMIIADRDNTEKVFRFDDDTVVRRDRTTLATSDLKVGDTVVVIGDPDDNSEIDAKFIRIESPETPVSTTPAP